MSLNHNSKFYIVLFSVVVVFLRQLQNSGVFFLTIASLHLNVQTYLLQFCIYILQFFVHIEERLRVNPNSLSSPFPLVMHIHVRVRANSGFDRGVGVSERGRYPLKPSIFRAYLKPRGTQNTLIQIIQRVFSA